MRKLQKKVKHAHIHNVVSGINHKSFEDFDEMKALLVKLDEANINANIVIENIVDKLKMDRLFSFFMTIYRLASAKRIKTNMIIGAMPPEGDFPRYYSDLESLSVKFSKLNEREIGSGSTGIYVRELITEIVYRLPIYQLRQVGKMYTFTMYTSWSIPQGKKYTMLESLKGLELTETVSKNILLNKGNFNNNQPERWL